jgi:hypothetical protein
MGVLAIVEDIQSVIEGMKKGTQERGDNGRLLP